MLHTQHILIRKPMPIVTMHASSVTIDISALEALRNALYKFKTYLLTY